jgi:mono/diheme cytochrome c family protein
MKTFFKILLALLGLLLLVGGGGYGWASLRVSALRARAIETHRADFPVPFPLSAEEREALLEGADADSAALARAIERGRHLVQSRYPCGECHGANFGGGTMIDNPAMGRLLGPNLTMGRGSTTAVYGPADWDRAVRHGVLADGAPSLMPAVDFQLMSDQELSDIVAYIRSLPPADREAGPSRLGPLGAVLVASGRLPFAADLIPSHFASHPVLPPATEVSVEFGRHLAGVCTGCHGASLAGGPVPGGDPSWPAAANLTPHPNALGTWSYDDFAAALRNGIRPDGTPFAAPMSNLIPYARNMTEVELQALWNYLRSVPAIAPTG